MRGAVAVSVSVVSAVVLLTASCAPGPEASPPSAAATVSTFALPSPRTEGSLSLEEALAGRHSVRSFTGLALTTGEVSQLLWAAQGVNRPSGARTAPSAGGLYPLEIFVALPGGVWHYVPQGHAAEVVSEVDLRGALAAAALGQEAVAAAPAVFVITAVPSRTAEKYGSRAERYVALEAGHAAQDLLLEAVALGLGAVPIGAFTDAGVLRILRLPESDRVLYLVPVGHPAEA